MDFDVLVVGAGPGGCLAARDLARAGLSVGLFDSSQRDNLSNTIIIETERAMFDTVGMKVPIGDEIPYHQKRMRVFSANRKESFTIEGEHPAMAVYLDRFVKSMLNEAEAAGAKFMGGHTAIAPIIAEKRVSGVSFKTKDGDCNINARLVIDATGFNAALIRKLDPAMGIGFEDRKHDVVIAENHFHQIDQAKAKAAVDQGLHYDNEVWNRLGIYGNYSTEYSYLSLDKKLAYILIGLKAEAGQPPLDALIDRFKEEQGYYGKRLYGGKGPIRVRRSWDKLVTDGLMVIGEAACQVIPAHGSGVASALYAGHLSAKVAVDALKSGEATTEALWPYSYEYMTDRGATLATYDANILVVESLPNESIAKLVETKAMHPEDLFNAAIPKPIGMSLNSLPSRLSGILRNPALIRPVVKMGLAIAAVKSHYSKYPKTYDAATFEAWKNKNRSIFEPLEEKRKA